MKMALRIQAELVGELLDVSPSDVQTLMRRSEITGLCERGAARANTMAKATTADCSRSGGAPGVAVQEMFSGERDPI